jgi:uncharacterized membrane protein
MKLLNLLFRRETAVPAVAVTFASVVSVALVVARVGWTRHLHYAFLIWNLFLAWLPLVFALLADERYRKARKADWHFAGLLVAWLLFFPNAPYIFTDLIHLTTHYYTHFWVDLVLVLSCALTGLVLGFLSLYLIHCMAVKMFGRILSWIFIAGIAGLSSFGIYLGRFLRFNSWDIIFKPVALYHGIGSWVSDPLQNSRTAAFPVLFATFLFISYVMLYALTHLRPAMPEERQLNPNAIAGIS